MPGKAKKAAPAKKGAKAGDDPNNDPEVMRTKLKNFLKNYEKDCEKNNVCCFKGIKDRLAAIIRSEEGPSKLTFPVIIDQPCTKEDLQVLFQHLNEYRQFEELLIWRASLGDEGCWFLCLGWLKQLPKLPKLEMIDNRLGPRSCMAIKEVLTGNEDILTNLILDYNDFGDEGAALLSDGVQWSKSLAYLSVAYCSIGEKGAQSIGELIVGKNESIKNLNLQGNPLGNSGIISIAKNLEFNSTLEILNIADTHFGDEEALTALGQGLEKQKAPVLANLNLNYNILNENGAKAFVTSLAKAENVTKLKIYEKMKTEIFALFANQIKKNKTKKGKKGKKGAKKGGKKKKKKA